MSNGPSSSANPYSRTATRSRVLIGSVAGLIVGLVIWLVAGRTNRPAQSLPPAKPPAAASATRPLSPVLSPAEVAEKFTHASTHAERLKWVRHPAQVAPAMAEFFSSGRGAHESVASINAMDPAGMGATTIKRFGVTLADGRQRLLCIVMAHGEAKVDFKAYARHGSVPWEDLLAGKAGESSEVRVFIQHGTYYNYEFAYEVRWQNFTATSPDLDLPVQLYLARNHPDAKRLGQLNTKHPVRATVAIRALGDSHLKRQFEITRFLAAGWVIEDESDPP